jgi:hypothetical protein
MATKKAKKAKTRSKSGTATIAFATNAVWSGSIARLRIYDTQTSTGNVFAYKTPGNNSDLVGTTTDPSTIDALFRARDNGRTITGFTNAANRIVWLDY